MSNQRVVALLPMKANSERVRGKNFRSFAGKPLFRWMLDTLLAMPEVSEIVINTDARRILASHGLSDADRVRIRDRHPDICGDFVSMNDVLADDVANVDADVFLMTHTTNPLLGTATIRGAIRMFLDSRANDSADSVFTVNRVQTRFYRADASPVNHDPNNLVRTQDLEPWFEENSNLYVFSRESFAATGARIGERPVMFESPRLESADIDDEEGWHLAELIALANRRTTEAA